jgi:hypothetical protein
MIQDSNNNQWLRMYASHGVEGEEWKYEYTRASGGNGESVIETEIRRTEDSY